MTQTVFTPGATVQLAVTTTTGNVALGKPLGNLGVSRQLRVSILPAEAATYIAFGKNSSVVATVNDMRLLPGVIELFTVGPEITHVAAITAATTSTLSVTTGVGE